jgi:hypothetical protein
MSLRTSRRCSVGREPDCAVAKDKGVVVHRQRRLCYRSQQLCGLVDRDILVERLFWYMPEVDP